MVVARRSQRLCRHPAAGALFPMLNVLRFFGNPGQMSCFERMPLRIRRFDGVARAGSITVMARSLVRRGGSTVA